METTHAGLEGPKKLLGFPDFGTVLATRCFLSIVGRLARFLLRDIFWQTRGVWHGSCYGMFRSKFGEFGMIIAAFKR